MTVLASAYRCAARIPLCQRSSTTVAVANSPVGDYETLRTITEINPGSYTLRRGRRGTPADSGEGLDPDRPEASRARSRSAVFPQTSASKVAFERPRIDEAATRPVSPVTCFKNCVPEGTCSADLPLDRHGRRHCRTDRSAHRHGDRDRSQSPSKCWSIARPCCCRALGGRAICRMEAQRERFDFHVLDDPDNPLLLRARDQSIAGPNRGHRISDRRRQLDPFTRAPLKRCRALSGVYFAFASATLAPSLMKHWRNSRMRSTRSRAGRFRIEGHTDSNGNGASISLFRNVAPTQFAAPW